MHTRYLCKKLRSRFPELKILVGRWSPTVAGEGGRDAARPGRPARPRPDLEADALEEATADARPTATAVVPPMVARLEEAGANFVATTLQETRRQLDGLVPILVQRLGDRHDGAVASSPDLELAAVGPAL